MSKQIIEMIASATSGTSYKAHRYNLDLVNERPSIEYGDSDTINLWKSRGESTLNKTYVSLIDRSQRLALSGKQLLKFFLDGSRRVFKVDDIAYRGSGGRKKIYPVVAGQIGVGCCERIDKKIIPLKFKRKILISLPDIADADGKAGFFPSMINKLNETAALKRLNMSFDAIVTYNTSRHEESFEDRAVTKILEEMDKLEQNTVAELVNASRLNQYNYLVKDGSLQYVLIKGKTDKKTIARFKNKYNYVIGVSKSFNPEVCLDVDGKSNPGFIADLPLYHRTPAACFENPKRFGDIQFAIWYVRLHDKRRTRNPFDGIIKVEKMIVTEEERDNGIDSELIDELSALLINERNPVCYGSDVRWANHIYPVYLTETFVKSKYISTESFLQLF